MSGDGRLRREIDALLRWHVRGGVQDRLRGPVLGMRSSAIPAIPGAVPVPRSWLMESGWLRFEDRGGGTDGYVYVYPDSGLGIWTLVPPGVTLDAHGSYETQVTRTAYTPYQFADALSRHRPERYSGLMRLFVQALIGANRTVDDVLGGEIAPSRALAQWNGLIRSPGGAYWHCWLNRRTKSGSTYNSIRARKLKVPTGAADQYARLQAWDSEMSSTDASYLEADLLGKLEYDTTATTLILIAEGTASLNSMFAFGYQFMPWGLCWRWQARGAPDENTCGAVWTVQVQSSTGGTGYETYFHTFRRAFLDITFAGDLPSATIGVEDTVRAEFDTIDGPCKVYWTDLTEVKEWWPSSKGPSIWYQNDIGVPVAFLSWYGSDGVLHELTHVREDEEVLSSSYVNIAGCEGPASFSDDVEQLNRFTGFRFDDVELPPQTTHRGAVSNHQTASASRVYSSMVGGCPAMAETCSSGPSGNYECYAVSYNLLESWSGIQVNSRSPTNCIIISDIPGVAWIGVLPTVSQTCHSGSGSSSTLTSGGWQRYRIEANGTLYDRLRSFDAACYMSPYAGSSLPGFLACINDASHTVADESVLLDVLGWLGTPRAGWEDSYSFGVDYWTPADPPTMLDFQPALAGYVVVGEMFGAGLGDAFDAQAYQSLGRLIGGA